MNETKVTTAINSTPYESSDGPLLDGDAGHTSLSIARGEGGDEATTPIKPPAYRVAMGSLACCSRPAHVVEGDSGLPVRCCRSEGDARTWAARANDGARLLAGERPEDVGDEPDDDHARRFWATYRPLDPSATDAAPPAIDTTPAPPLTRQLLDDKLRYYALRARMTGPGREPERAVHELFRRFSAWVIERLDATESTDIPTLLDRVEASAWSEAGRIAQASRSAPRAKFYRALLGPLLTAEVFSAEPVPGSGGRYDVGVEGRDEGAKGGEG